MFRSKIFGNTFLGALSFSRQGLLTGTRIKIGATYRQEISGNIVVNRSAADRHGLGRV